MADEDKKDEIALPNAAEQYIESVVKKMGYRDKVRRDVRDELRSHFADALKDCKGEQERNRTGQALVRDFGDVKLLAILMRRAKKRCRPLWKKLIVRSLQAAAVLLMAFVIYTGWFVTGRPVVTVDYLALWNQMSRPDVLPRDNALTDYEKALAVFNEPNRDLKDTMAFKTHRGVPDPNFDTLTSAEQDAIIDWADGNRQAWLSFVSGTEKPYFYRPYSYDPNSNDPWMMGVRMPPLIEFKNLARLGIWQSRIELRQGQTQEAIDACIAVARAGRHWQRRQMLIEQLVGLSMCRLAYDEILHLAQAANMSAEQVANLRRQLGDTYPEGYPPMNLESEKMVFLDVVQHVFTSGGPGGGHMVAGGLQNFMDPVFSDPDAASIALNLIKVGASMIHAGRDETVARGSELYDLEIRLAGMTPWQRHIEKPADAEQMLMALPGRKFFLIRMLMPAMERCSEIAFRARALHEATVTILALKQYKLEKGEYPADLGELVRAGYLKEPPMDPYSDRPLVYRKIEGDFTLYSVGLNFQDDNGQSAPPRGKSGTINRWDSDEGDAVFWPIPKPPETSPDPL